MDKQPNIQSGEGGPVQRRKVLAAIAAGSLVVAFDPIGQRWIRAAEASGGCEAFPGHQVPQLDGTLHLDLPTRTEDSTDLGNLVQQLPAAVLRPASAQDVAKMVKFCRHRNIKVAARGQHHTMFGQGLTCGLIIETNTLNTIHSIGPEGADCDAGVLWTDLLSAAFAQGLRPRGVTGFTDLSIGGTLSVGGCPTSYQEGGLVEHIQELTVVTGKGKIVECSDCHNEDLFESALAGLGQCGIITRAKIDLVPAHPRARTYLLHYADSAAFFSDFRKLLDRGELDESFTVCLPPGLAPFVYQINATIYYDPAAPPDDAFLLRDLLIPPPAIQTVDRTFLENAFFVNGQIAFLRAVVDWDHLLKPWFDVWVPGAVVESFVGSTVANLTPFDVGSGGFILILPQRRSQITRPLYRVPAEDPADDWVFLFDILTTSVAPGPDPVFVDLMLTRNRTLFEQARDLGGTRYAIGALEFSPEDWEQQFGSEWKRFRQRKKKFDPANILTPGPSIFDD